MKTICGKLWLTPFDKLPKEDEDGKVLLRQDDIKTKWYKFFSQLLNETRGPKEVRGHASNVQSQHKHGSNRGITTNEASKALKEMGQAKAVGPDNIPIEVWRFLGDEGIQGLTSLFNVI